MPCGSGEPILRETIVRCYDNCNKKNGLTTLGRVIVPIAWLWEVADVVAMSQSLGVVAAVGPGPSSRSGPGPREEPTRPAAALATRPEVPAST